MAGQEGQALHALLTVLITYFINGDPDPGIFVFVVKHKVFFRNLAALPCPPSLQTAWIGCLTRLHVDRSFR